MVDKKQLAQFADFYATLSPGIVDKSIDALAIPGKAKRDIAHIRSRKESGNRKISCVSESCR